MRNARLFLVALLSLSLGACPRPKPNPGSPPEPPTDYSFQTPESLRAVHRTAVAQLRAGKWQEALDTLEAPGESPKPLTHYLRLIALVRIPEQALSADQEAKAAIAIQEGPPFLGNSEHRVVDQTRAWIAGIQDYVADQVKQRGREYPLPEYLRNTHDLSALKAWRQRGDRYDPTTYARTKSAVRLPADFQARLDGLANDKLYEILSTTLTGMTVPKPPAPVLPEDGQL